MNAFASEKFGKIDEEQIVFKDLNLNRCKNTQELIKEEKRTRLK